MKLSTIFASLALLSLILAAIVAIAFIHSFSSDWQLFTLHKDEEKFALRSRFGQFVIVGPPIEPLGNPLPRTLIAQMSNADFEWSPIGSQWVCGAVRRDSPTWHVYQRFRGRDSRGMGLEPDMRIFIARAKDDPQRFVPAHMLLMFAAETKRTKPRAAPQRWLETGFRIDADGARIPEVIIRADAAQKAPDFALRWDIKQEWADVMETPRSALFHGWIFLGALLLPFAWIGRPRRRKKSFRRWTLNFFVLASSIICIAALVFWTRSQFVDEQFIFARRPAPKVANNELDSISSVSSAKGKLLFLRKDTIRVLRPWREPWGYQENSPTWPSKVSGLSVTGEKSAAFPGVEFYQLPSQLLLMPASTIGPFGRVAPVPAVSSIPQLMHGGRALSIRWSLIVFLTALLPSFWLANALLWRKRIRSEDRHLARQCPACGYDIRATPNRCPECGEVPQNTSIPRFV